jgi:hypothetical protein
MLIVSNFVRKMSVEIDCFDHGFIGSSRNLKAARKQKNEGKKKRPHWGAFSQCVNMTMLLCL